MCAYHVFSLIILLPNDFVATVTRLVVVVCSNWDL